MNLYEQPRPLLQQLGQESFAKSKRTLTSKEICNKRNKKSTLLKYGGVHSYTNSTQQIWQINPMKCDYQILSKSNELKYSVRVISKDAMTIKKNKKNKGIVL